MKKNIYILEEKSPINQKINNDKNKKKYISFSYISFLFISSLLILDLFYSIKLYIYQRNKYIKFLSNEKELNKIIYKYKTEEGKEQDNQNIKINNTKNYINFNNLSIETTGLNIFKIHLLSSSFTKALILFN